MTKEQTPLFSWPTCTYTHSMQPPRCQAMFKPAESQSELLHDRKSASDFPPLSPGDQVRKAPCLGSRMWNPTIIFRCHDRWSQVGTSTTMPKDSCVDQLKLPIPRHSAWISQQMMVHFISTMSCLLHHPWNSATIHQVNNRNPPQTPVVKPPSQMSSIHDVFKWCEVYI